MFVRLRRASAGADTRGSDMRVIAFHSTNAIAKVLWSEPSEAYYAAPGTWRFSRFLDNLIELEESPGLVSGIIPALRKRLRSRKSGWSGCTHL